MTTDELTMITALEGNRTKPAIFAVEHVPSKRRLIVATTNFSKRLYDQRRYLTRANHCNAALEEDAKADGPNAFRFIVLDLSFDPRQLRALKRLHIEAARQLGVPLYNQPDPPSRALLLNELQRPTTSAAAT